VAYDLYRRVQTVSLWVGSFSGVFYLRDILDDEQEVEDEEVPAQSKAVEARKSTEEPEAGEGEDGGLQADGEEEEEDVDIPLESPEDSWFIPMGLARQRPQTFYKGNDPEWQSFVEFSHDKKRNSFVRSLFHLPHL